MKSAKSSRGRFTMNISCNYIDKNYYKVSQTNERPKQTKKYTVYQSIIKDKISLNLDEIEGYSHQMDNNTMMEIKACLMEIRKILDIK
jgi:hypothetical protein